MATGKCNLKCNYCGGSFPENLVPHKIGYRLDDLITFLSEDKEAVVAFYGGEPLLNPNFVRSVMDSVKASNFVIQTNGLLVEKLERHYWGRFDAVLLSIDGVEWVNDRNRCAGVYGRTLEAAKRLRMMGFKGDLLARMTMTEQGDIYRDVAHLLSLNLFDHVHWQLNVVWSNRWRNFNGWTERSYNPGISKLLDLWIEELKNGRVLGVAPIQGILTRIIFGGVKPPCGSGWNSITISTDGRVLACPIAFDAKWAELGHISNFKTKELGKIEMGAPCRACEEFEVCGGRCLYAHMERLWGEEGLRSVCEVTRHLIREIRRKLQVIRVAMKKTGLEWEDIAYPSFNNTVEVIP